MKMSDVAAGFAYEQPQTEAHLEAPPWLATPVDYGNRDVVATALRALSPDWPGLAPAVAKETATSVPTTPIAVVLGGGSPDPDLLLHEGRW